MHGAAVAVIAGRTGIARAQRRPVLGVLHWESAAATDRVEDLRRALAEVGLVEGRTVTLDWRWAERRVDRARAEAADLVRQGVDALFIHSTPTVHAAKESLGTTPVVFIVSDPLATGIVTNLARPGGTMTGQGSVGPELGQKRLELLRELIPGLARVAFLGSTLDPNAGTFAREAVAAGTRVGVAVEVSYVRGAAEFEDAFRAMKAAGAQALLVQPLFLEDRAHLALLQQRYALPCVSDQVEFARAGMLLSFGPDRGRMMSRAAIQIDRVLKGARAGDLPVELPTHFAASLNRGAATRLGIAMPDPVLARVDEVIE